MKIQTMDEIINHVPGIIPNGPVGSLVPYVKECMHQFASQESALAVAKRDDQLEPLIIAMNDYITVLGKELDDCVVMLSVHGWQSKRVQEGIDARNKILEIKKSLSTPAVEPSAEIAQVEPIKKTNNCKCTVEETSGWTTVKCCNICGLPIQKENWYFVQPEPSIPIREIERWIDMEVRDARGLLNLRKFQLFIESKKK